MANDSSFSSKLATYGTTAVLVLLSGVFILEFGGPQSQGCASATAPRYAARIYDTVVTQGDFRANEVAVGFDRYAAQVAQTRRTKEQVLNGLIERSLLAHEARRLGLKVTEDEVFEHLQESGTMLVTLEDDVAETPVPVFDRDRKFDAEQAKRFIRFGLQRSVGEYVEAQAEELLARRLRAIIGETAVVSPGEAWDAYVAERDQARVKYVRFSPAYFRERLTPTASELDAYVAAHQAKVDEEYERQKHRFTGLEKQVHARHVLIKVDADADEATKDAARAKAADVLRRARAGESFEALARANSEDPGSARRGGDLGWNARGRMVAPFDEAQFALAPGAISDVVESQFGFHVIKVEGVREGDVDPAEAKRELAERMYVDEKAEEQAKGAARDALAKLKSGTTVEALEAELATTYGTDDEDPNRPRIEETRSFGRSDSPIPGPFDSRPLAAAAFELTEEQRIPDEVVDLGGELIVMRLEERTRASREDFDGEVRERIENGLRRAKQAEVVDQFVAELRRRAEAEGSIRVNDAALAYDVDPATGES